MGREGTGALTCVSCSGLKRKQQLQFKQILKPTSKTNYASCTLIQDGDRVEELVNVWEKIQITSSPVQV